MSDRFFALTIAGGRGERLRPLTNNRPKPMVEINGKPIISYQVDWMRSQGVTDVIFLCGYKGEMIKEYFYHYMLHNNDVTIKLGKNRKITIHENHEAEDWEITLVDTGENTLKGARIHKIMDYIDDDFMVTYGDGLSDVNLEDLLKFHKSHGKLITMTAVRPAAKFGELKLNRDQVSSFEEKPQLNEGWVNGGFFVMEPECMDLIEGDTTMLEREPLVAAAKQGDLIAYRHEGFWQCMDTKRDKDKLGKILKSKKFKF